MTICTYSLEKEFLRVYSFPKNSYDDLHLATLWKRSFQLGSTYDDLLLVCGRGLFNWDPFLPMTICTCLFCRRGVFNYDLLLSYKFL